jgi:hypothetical protein
MREGASTRHDLRKVHGGPANQTASRCTLSHLAQHVMQLVLHLQHRVRRLCLHEHRQLLALDAQHQRLQTMCQVQRNVSPTNGEQCNDIYGAYISSPLVSLDCHVQVCFRPQPEDPPWTDLPS